MFMHSQKSKAGKAAFSTTTTLMRHLQKKQQRAVQELEKRGKFHTKKKKKANDQIYTNRKIQSNNQFFPTCLDSGFPNRRITQIEIRVSSKPQFFPDHLDEFPDRVRFPKLRFGQVSNLNFSSTVWMNFQTGSDSPN